MKILSIVSLLLTTLLVVSSNPADLSAISSLNELVDELEKQKLSAQVAKGDANTANDRSQHGRVLATYEYNIMENTGRALEKLDGVSLAVGNVSSGIGALNSALNDSSNNILGTLKDIQSSVGNGSSIVKTLEGINTSVNGLLGSFNGNGTAGNTTFVGQFQALYSLLDAKLTNIEKTLGYDNYPPVPSNLGRKRRDTDIDPEDSTLILP